MKPAWVERKANSPRESAISSRRLGLLKAVTLLLSIPAAAQQAPSVAVNPQFAIRGSIVTVTLTAAPKDAKKVEVMLDAITLPVPVADPNGNYRVQIPTDASGPSFVPLGKHRVSVQVDGSWFTGSELLDVERPQPAPQLTSISPTYLIKGGAGTVLTLTGENFAQDVPQDNQILFDGIAQAVTWDGCGQTTDSKQKQSTGAHGKVVAPSTIELCNLVPPDKISVEVNVRQGERATTSGLFLAISRYGRSAIVLWSFAITLACVGLVLLLVLFAHGSSEYGVWSILFLDPETNSYSLSKLQFYLWTDAAILAYSYLVIGRLFAQRLDFPDVPSSLPGIIAIGAGTAIGSQFVTNVHGPKGGGPENPSLGDFVTSGGITAPDRVQMLLWTLVGVVGFCVATFRSDPWTITTLPQIGNGLMLLMGISSAGYLGGKLARKPGPVLSSITLTPSGPDKVLAAATTNPVADLSQPIAAAQQILTRANAAAGQPTQDLSANALSAAQNALAALKAGLDAAQAAKADLLNTLTDNAAKADAASRILAAEFSGLVAQGADSAKVEAARQSAELAEQLAAAVQDLATGASQAIGSAQAQAAPAAGALPKRIIELRGRNLSDDANFEINGADLPFRMLALVDGTQAPEIISPEDDPSATNMARGLRLTIDPNTLGPADRATYNSWFKTAGKDLKFGISNPDGQISEITVTLPPGTEQKQT
jgi:hypothetical protein